MNIESKDAYIQEIISVGFESYEESVGVMTFSVIHYDKNACQDILNIINDQINTVKSDEGNCEVLSLDVLEKSRLSLASEKDNYYTLKWDQYDSLIRVQGDRNALEASYNLPLVESNDSNILRQIIIFRIIKVGRKVSYL